MARCPSCGSWIGPAVRPRRLTAELAWLLETADGPVQRRDLALLLWGDAERGRRRLRVLLWKLRRQGLMVEPVGRTAVRLVSAGPKTT